MLSEHDRVLQEYEIEKNKDFFIMLRDVCCGFIARKQLMRFYQNTGCDNIREWKRLNIIEPYNIGGGIAFRLKCVGKLNIRWRPVPTASLILRSYMRLEYYFSRGLRTPEEILSKASKGNDRAIRMNTVQPLLEQYQDGLAERNINIPFLDSPDVAKEIEDMAYRDIFLSNVKFADGAIIPHICYYDLRGSRASGVAGELLETYRAYQSIFHSDRAEVRPVIHIITFSTPESKKAVFRRLTQEREFLLFEKMDFDRTFPIHQIGQAFPYLKAGNLV